MIATNCFPSLLLVADGDWNLYYHYTDEYNTTTAVHASSSAVLDHINWLLSFTFSRNHMIQTFNTRQDIKNKTPSTGKDKCHASTQIKNLRTWTISIWTPRFGHAQATRTLARGKRWRARMGGSPGGVAVRKVAAGRGRRRHRPSVVLLLIRSAAAVRPPLLHLPSRRRRPGSVPRLERRCFLPGPKCEERVGLGRYWISGGG
jgi:hypothetical protein